MSRGCRIGAAAFFCAALIFIQFGVRWLPGGYGGQSSKLISVLVDCPGLSSIRCSLTVRVVWRAVANNEIILNLLKIRKKAIGHKSSKR